MKNRLQYIYSIGVFCGVLVTAYLMMNQDDARPMRAYQPSNSFRSEATTLDPAMTQLFEMENALNREMKKETPEAKRIPSDIKTPSVARP